MDSETAKAIEELNKNQVVLSEDIEAIKNELASKIVDQEKIKQEAITEAIGKIEEKVKITFDNGSKAINERLDKRSIELNMLKLEIEKKSKELDVKMGEIELDYIDIIKNIQKKPQII
jgi:hypothetical protein